MAFPGAVGAKYSEGCNQLIRNNGATLITSALDLLNTMGWQPAAEELKARKEGIERQMFPDLTDEEQTVVEALTKNNDQQINMLAVQTGITISSLAAILFSLEMKGVVRPMAGGTYHLLTI
jgi:DNA processing protein